LFAKYLDKKRIDNAKPFVMRYKFNNKIVVENFELNGMQYFVFNRKNCSNTIFYFHGGAYIDKPSIFHFRLVEKLLLHKDMCVVFPIYPRLPDNDYQDCYKKIILLIDDFVRVNNVNNITLMGDSAGGGLALGVAQKVKCSHEFFNTGNQKVVLISPWLDIATNNKDIDDIIPYDYQLSQVHLQKLGQIWSRNNVKVTEVSPIFGDLDVGEITVITGTREILYPDMLILKDKIDNGGNIINFYAFDNMAHDFVLLPTPEANEAFEILIQHI